ncbi:SCO2525 family SAM-dependent methyltransferase [Hamadaea tsunoensis]|uniref:SCO2525 family SAM-dependent methyltransferase n=1 Tax=Hamadaea tsunoensis TaxID=53368 RepID=UPI0012F9167A|nr:SCO2525 family SAM-dependent methyltransferase [Hamadaea tsunoensis]
MVGEKMRGGELSAGAIRVTPTAVSPVSRASREIAIARWGWRDWVADLVVSLIRYATRLGYRAASRRNVNRAWAWDRFNPVPYFKHNYATLRKDDRQILMHVRDFFTAHFDGESIQDIKRRRLHGLDIGSGSNLYPALTMLPFCDKITLRDYSPRNVRWMRNEVRQPHRSWKSFWRVLAKSEPYGRLPGGFAQALRTRAVTQHGSIFELHKNHWDIGTMFFVAESLTMERREFDVAVTRFVESLRDGAPFACAFMRNSSGYRVDVRDFPAVAIDELDVQTCLDKVADKVHVHLIELKNSGTPLRDGYGGMIVATGLRRKFSPLK